MAQRKIITVTCDQCDHEGKPNEQATVSYKIKIDRMPRRAIDVCPDHASQIERLKSTLANRGVSVA